MVDEALSITPLSPSLSALSAVLFCNVGVFLVKAGSLSEIFKAYDVKHLRVNPACILVFSGPPK